MSKPKTSGASFKRLPFNFCAVSLQPFSHPVCTADGTIFDLTNILPWLKKHGTNPVTGLPLKSSELIKLNFAKNEEGEMVDPVTFKVFTDNTHIVALKNTGNVFAYDTVERLNIKAKLWQDLVTDEAFTRKDIITIQDPQNIESRDLSSFKYLQEGASTLTDDQVAERNDPNRNLNTSALGNAAKILKAKEAVAKAREQRSSNPTNPNRTSRTLTSVASFKNGVSQSSPANTFKKPNMPYNAAQHTTGKAAASFTSTGVTPHTGDERALLSEEEYMLKPKRVKQKGYARLQTSHGELNMELNPEFAPKAVWNFIALARKGYYNGVAFHRNIRNFMIQGGDPTGTGKGGSSIWGKNFADEFDGPSSHDGRGIVSMANKGKDTNSSQFFILYRAAKHLDRKHTVFGKIVGSEETLRRLEDAKVHEGDKRPIEPITIETINIFVDPFEEWRKEKAERDSKEFEKEEIKRQGGTEDDRTTWTGKRIRGDGRIDADLDADARRGIVGKYLGTGMIEGTQTETETGHDEVVEEWEGGGTMLQEEPVKKKIKVGAGGFGNFDGW